MLTTRYFTDYLYLPRINAVSEGLWGIAIVMTLSPLLGGYSFWTGTTFGIQHNRFLVFLPIFTFGYNVQMHLSKILKKTSLQSFLQASLFAVTLSTLAVAYVLRAETPSRVVLYTQGLTAAKSTILCQLAHVSSRRFAPFRLTSVIQLLVVGVLAAFPAFPCGTCIAGIVLALDFSRFAWVIVTRVAELSGVKIFVIAAPKN